MMHATTPNPKSRKAGDYISKAFPLFIVGVPLTAIIAVGSVLIMIGSGLTAGSSGGSGLMIAIGGLAAVTIYWYFGIRWLLKPDK